MKKQAFNPYLPGWEFIPDGEPYVFGDRVYVYGSHDRYNGHAFCLNDYVCWSAPLNDLADWRYEGVIYPKTGDPANADGRMCLYAPDVTVGPDGRYYLYYVLDKLNVVSVAVCDEPAGRYTFLGYVRDKDGARLGAREGDEPQFDPGVLTEGDRTYLYTGFSAVHQPGRSGAFCTVLGPDMLTITEEPVLVCPCHDLAQGTDFADHPFFEASSMRKIGDMYYFIYSSTVMHELCYATGRSPQGPFAFGGVIVSNCDMHIDSYKPASKPMNYGANNHGSIVRIGGQWYIFYHRHTNGHVFSRQACVERIYVRPDGSIPQVEMTSCGLNGGPLRGDGYYHAYICCNLFCGTDEVYTGGAAYNGSWLDARFPKLMKDGLDSDETLPYCTNMTASATCGFKYFDFGGSRLTGIRVRGYCDGDFEVRTEWDGPVLGTIHVRFTNVWTDYASDIALPDGVHALYITYKGYGAADLEGFRIERKM